MTSPRLCTICSTALSRYNTDSTCANCSRKIATTPVAPLWLWDSEPLRQALADVDLGKALTIIRSAIGLTQLELASLLSWNQSTVQRAEAGTRDTLYDIRCFLEVADAVDMPREALTPLVLGSATSLHIGEQDADNVSLSRRQFGGLVASLAGAAAIGVGAPHVPTVADAAHMRYLRSAADKLYAKDLRMGAGTLARDGVRLYTRARRMLDESSYADSVGDDLLATAADLAVCVGWLSYDNSDQETARTLYTDALMLAEQSGDDAIAVRALEKMSLQSIYAARHMGQAGRAREAVRLSSRASYLAKRDPSPNLHALLAAREALAAAAAGDARGSEAAIGRAWREVDHGLDTDVPGWLEFVTPSEVHIAQAKSYLYLDMPEAASRLYRQSLDGALPARNAVNYRAALAHALTRAGDLRGAFDEAMQVMPTLEAEIASPRTLLELRPLRSALSEQRWGDEFVARFDAVTNQRLERP